MELGSTQACIIPQACTCKQRTLAWDTQGSKPNAEQAAAQVLSLPLYPQMRALEVGQGVRLVRFF